MRTTLVIGSLRTPPSILGETMRRFPSMLGAVVTVVLALSISAAGCSKPQGSATPTVGSSQSQSSASATSPAAAAKSIEREIPLAQFGSAKAKWHKTLASVTTRGDTLVVKVTRELSPAEAASVVAAAKAARDKLGLSVTQFQIQDAQSGYLLQYGSL